MCVMSATARISLSRITNVVHCTDAEPQQKSDGAPGVFASDLKPSIRLMRAMGLLPIVGMQTASPAFRLTSGIFVYSLVCYVVVSGLATSVAGIVMMSSKESHTHYDFDIFTTVLLVSLVPSLLLHPFYWFEAKKLVELLKKWVEFQEVYLRTTGTQLKLGLRRVSMFFTMAVPLVTFLVVMAELFVFNMVHPSLAVSYTVTVSMMVVHGIVWVLQCTAICRSSRLIKNYVKLTLFQESGTASLRALESLWLRLARLSTATAHAQSAAHLLATAICAIVFLMSAYGFLITFEKPQLRLTAVGLFTYAVICVIYLSMVYNTGYRIVATMNDFCDEEIDDLIARDENIREELHKFLHAVKLNQPSISFGGVVDVNRKFMSSFASTMLTYIVVLAQFKVGDEQPDDLNADPALSTPTIATKSATET